MKIEPKRIYLDHAATTPLCPAALAAMQEDHGNPSSLYEEGRLARQKIDAAREEVAAAIGCLFAEVLFTSSGTEAAQLAILGLALGNPEPERRRILWGAAEHHGVLESRFLLERLGYRVEEIPVNSWGAVEPARLVEAVSRDVLLVSIQSANNELGTENPVPDLVQIAHAQGAKFHTDAVQSFLTRPIHWEEWPVDLMSVAAHKVNGPKGVGAVFARAGTPLEAVTRGGGQERDMRAGTENVAGIIGFGAAVRWHRSHPEGVAHKRAARDRFLETLSQVADVDWQLSVPVDRILPGHAHLRFLGVSAESLLILADRHGLSLSSGAACSSGSVLPSHVLKAAGWSDEAAKEGLRVSFGVGSTLVEAEEAARRLAELAGSILSRRKSAL
ncbi:MAG TPA: cysteine desulfurase family protein [Fimbriimonadaceae bacterium]|nr:cysteine desulfurase family protein [Fimbriimonadaceae bacterium]HRJ32415.1 cysteine desulfurase family protein [Fimbriimonadaceae bacterium]